MERRAGLFPLVFATTLLTACAPQPESAPRRDAVSVSPPRHFIAQSLGTACLRDNRGDGPSAARAAAALTALDRNHQRYIDGLNRSTALSVEKDAYAAHWTPVLFNAYAAAAAEDAALARAILDGLGPLARNRRYLREPGLFTREEARTRPRCYADGPGGPCASHTPSFVGRMHTTLLIAATVLKPYATAEDRRVLDPYFADAYARFIAPEARDREGGLYDFANQGLGRLAYAGWTDDAALAVEEIAARRAEFLRLIEPSGYIDNNSFRGVRGLWYHSYGLDPALSYALVARRWGVDFFADPEVGPRLRAAVDKTALGIRDLAAFRAPGNRGDNLSTDPQAARPFVHQYALNLYRIAREEFGVVLPPDLEHERLARREPYSQIAGLSADCSYGSR